MNQPIMNALDAVAGSQASAYITMADGNRYCFMQLYLNEEVIELLPDDLLAAIKPRKFGDEEDRLWLFSEVEIFGEHIWGAGDEGDKQLEYFKNPINRVKFDEDRDARWWWERSLYASNSDGFCRVNSNGGASYYSATYSGGVCFGFYI